MAGKTPTPTPAMVKKNARSNARRSAAKQGVLFDLPPAPGLPDIPKWCPLCEQRMRSGGARRNDSPSLDRVLPGLGYVEQNVWWICHDCNRQKADLSPKQAYAMWDKVWEECKTRGLPLPSTRLRP